MLALLNLLLLAGGLYFCYLAYRLVDGVSTYLKMPERVLARSAERLAREAASSASSGQFAERDRLDDARNAILSRLSGRVWEFGGSEHDDFTARYFDAAKPGIPDHLVERVPSVRDAELRAGDDSSTRSAR